MRRPVIVWLAFAVCTALGAGVLAWFSHEMLRLDRANTKAGDQAALEENVRLALWRMDSALASIHGLESARPFEHYQPFFRARDAYTTGLAPLPPGSVFIPSPLLGFTPPFTHLHFQIDPDGSIHSPQSPEAALRSAALAAGASREKLDDGLATLQAWRAHLTAGEVAALSSLPLPSSGEPQRQRIDAVADRLAKKEQAAPEPELPQAMEKIQVGKSSAESENRAALVEEQKAIGLDYRNRYQADQSSASSNAPQVQQQSIGSLASNTRGGRRWVSDKSIGRGFTADEAPARENAGTPAPTAPTIASAPISIAKSEAQAKIAPPLIDSTTPEHAAPAEGAMHALWLGGELVFARRATVGDQIFIQGVWLDWPRLRSWLLARVSDLLPQADLQIVAASAADPSSGDSTRTLAFIPARIIPGHIVVPQESGPTALHISLATAWTSAGIGALALALLLRGTLRLSERRGAFVSAVTHELRTPLTTFRMYTEMLAGGMVPDEMKRRSYLDTLRKEAERLSHLVENVLSYARLERGRASSRVEDTTPGGLLARIEDRLRQRAEQGSLKLVIAFAPGLSDRALRVDTTAAEQILFNLVDNATKYARRPDGDGTITLSVEPDARTSRLAIRVADQGPGLTPAARKRLFQPFSKSATEAAHSQPGVGLGLALSRRLARDELHGDLVLESTTATGTIFRLELPMTQA